MEWRGSETVASSHLLNHPGIVAVCRLVSGADRVRDGLHLGPDVVTRSLEYVVALPYVGEGSDGDLWSSRHTGSRRQHVQSHPVGRTIAGHHRCIARRPLPQGVIAVEDLMRRPQLAHFNFGRPNLNPVLMPMRIAEIFPVLFINLDIYKV